MTEAVAPARLTDLMDTALGALAALARSGALDPAAEAQAVSRILMRDSNVLLIAKHFGASPRFAQHLGAALAAPASPLGELGGGGGPPARAAPVLQTPAMPDALVIGTGVAGLSAALRLLDAGANVVLMDKERRTGGNSAKASSGINAVLSSGTELGDSVDAFAADTARSAQRPAGGLIGLLAASSADAVRWLTDRTGIDLSRVAQLGGHSFPRTHRPASGMVGSELTVALSRAVRKFEATGQLRMMLGCRVNELLVEQSTGRVTGASYVNTLTGEEGFVAAHDTVLATGGFANDRTNTSLLAKHRPDLVRRHS